MAYQRPKAAARAAREQARFKDTCWKVAAEKGTSVEREVKNPAWIILHMQKRVESDELRGSTLKRIYLQLKAAFMMHDIEVPEIVQYKAKRLYAARDRKLDEEGDRVKRAPVIPPSAIRKLTRGTLTANIDKEILALETLIIGIVARARGNEVFLRTLEEVKTVTTDGVKYLELRPPRKTRKPRQTPEAALVPMGRHAPLQLQEITSRARAIRRRVLRTKGIDPANPDSMRFVNPDGRGDSRWRPQPFMRTIRGMFAKYCPDLNLKEKFTTHAARRTGATLGAVGGMTVEDLCKQADWADVRNAIYYMAKAHRTRVLGLATAFGKAAATAD